MTVTVHVDSDGLAHDDVSCPDVNVDDGPCHWQSVTSLAAIPAEDCCHCILNPTPYYPDDTIDWMDR